MRYKVDVIHTKTWVAQVIIEDAATEDDAEEEAIKLAESEKGKLEALQTIDWNEEDDFFESDGAEEATDDDAEEA